MSAGAAVVRDDGSSRPSPWLLVTVACGQLMVVLDATIMIVALPSAQQALGFSDSQRQWVITAYTLTFGGFLLLGGRLGDRIGAKKALIIGVAGFALASTLGSASQSFDMLVAARGLQGLFGALLSPAVLTILSTSFVDPKERSRAFGIYAAIALAGGASGLILGGVLTEYLDWRWCLFVNLPIALVVGLAASVTIQRERRPQVVRLDVPGAILGTGGFLALVYGLGAVSVHGWGSLIVVASLVAAGLFLVAFVLLESRVSSPILPLRVITNRNRSSAFLGIFLLVLANSGVLLFLTYFFQAVRHYSPLRAGVGFIPLMLVNGLTATQLSSRLLPRMRTRFLTIPGLLVATAGALVFTQLTPDASYPLHVLPAEILLGLGLGLCAVPLISTATTNAEPGDAGVISATTSTAQQIGASVGTALMNTIAASSTAAYLSAHAAGPGLLARAAVHGYTVASAYAAVILAVASIVVGVLIDARPAPVLREASV